MQQCDLKQPAGRLDHLRERLVRALPFLHWWRRVNRRTLKADLWAGLTGAVIVLPQGVAFAAIAGLPPEYGLYSAMIPALVAALFGSSLHLISGPTTTISLVLLSNLAPFAEPGSAEYIRLALTMTLLVGLIQLGLGLARMGVMVNFVSHSVVTGFAAGAAILIATGQLGHFLGLPALRGGSFLAAWAGLARLAPEANPRALAVGAATLIAAVAIRRLNPRLPALLLAMIAGSLFCLLLDGKAHGVALLSALPASLPPLSLPGFDPETMRRMIPGALALAMLGLAEAVSIARAVADRSGQLVDNSQEFVGQGLSNIAGSFCSAYASSGSFTRTGVNFESGAQTPLSAVFSAAFLALVVLLVAPLTAFLPIPAMAGVILLVAWRLIDFRSIREIARADKNETGILAATFLATLFTQIEFAIFAGVMLSLLLYLKRTSHPRLIALSPDPQDDRRSLVSARRKILPECPQLKILRLDGSIFFGAVQHILEDLHRIMRENPEQYHILLIGSGINFVDADGCHMLFNEAHNVKLSGRELSFCSLKGEVMEMLERGGCLARCDPQHIYPSERAAIAGIVPRLDPERCACCPLRVFRECRKMPGGEEYEEKRG